MKNFIIKSTDIAFRFTELQDLDEVIKIEHSEENKNFVYQWSKEQHIDKIMDEDWLHITIVDNDQQKIVGYILLEGIKSPHETIELTRITINEKGKGYGRKAVRLVKRLCFENLNCHRLWLDVFEENKNAIRLYETENFVYEGTLRECKKYGNHFYSMRVMSMIKQEYLK